MTATQPAPARSLHKVSSSLGFWKVHDPAIRTDLMSTILRTDMGWWLVDPAPVERRALDEFTGDGLRLLGILLTNENHERDAAGLSQELGIPIHSHEAALGRMDLQPDFFFRDGEVLKGGVRVIHLPGATEGETCFCDERSGTLVMGDALIHLKKTGFTFLPDKYCRDPEQSRKSLRSLLDRKFDVMAFAHGEPIMSGAKQQLTELLQS